ncbi:hypothetical protein O181_003303 [Austropuccinia psidii MF-1]|uniref:Uncharacterized protein n=1 Tax=Austropuccinia psidii MF-1 TaxID=1389203 RepID=A0A9Q3BEF7_9BASI|nr:hypothetical protein [Austropuccinia psidii MF-1]
MVGHIFSVGKATAYQVSQSVAQEILVVLHDSTIIFPAADEVDIRDKIKDTNTRTRKHHLGDQWDAHSNNPAGK